MQSDLVLIDGSFGEGGGQILRTSLALSLITGKPFRMINIRAKRRKPGLLRQHLTAICAAAVVGDAETPTAELGSTEILFIPKQVTPSEYEFSIGSAGSTTLVLQTVLPPLLIANDRSRLHVTGGTHNPQAPPFDFVEHSFLPVVRQMGPKVITSLIRHGFYPAGGGVVDVVIEPDMLRPVELLDRGELLYRHAVALIANLPILIAERELAFLEQRLDWDHDNFEISVIENSSGPGNVLLLLLEFEHVTEVFSAFGKRGVSAEKVAERALDDMTFYLNSGAVVGEYLADQLMVPFAISRGGAFVTTALSSHAQTNLEVIQKFLDIPIARTENRTGLTTVRFG